MPKSLYTDFVKLQMARLDKSVLFKDQLNYGKTQKKIHP